MAGFQGRVKNHPKEGRDSVSRNNSLPITFSSSSTPVTLYPTRANVQRSVPSECTRMWHRFVDLAGKKVEREEACHLRQPPDDQARRRRVVNGRRTDLRRTAKASHEPVGGEAVSEALAADVEAVARGEPGHPGTRPAHHGPRDLTARSGNRALRARSARSGIGTACGGIVRWRILSQLYPDEHETSSVMV